MVRSATIQRKDHHHGLRMGDRSFDLLSGSVDNPDEFQVGSPGDRRPAAISVFRLDAGKLCDRPGAFRLFAIPVELGDYRRCFHIAWHHRRSPGCMVHGICAVEAYQGHSPVDAFNQNAAGRRRPLSDLSAVHSVQTS